MYVQHSTDGDGLQAIDKIAPNIVRFPGGNDGGFSPSGTILSSTDNLGNYFYFSTNGKLAYKAVVSGQKVSLQVTNGTQMGFETLSGYWCMDNHNVIYVLNQKSEGSQEIISLGLADPKDYNSNLKVLDRWPVPPGFVQKGPNPVFQPHGLKEKILFDHDELAGIKILYSGELAVTTRYGKVMIVDRQFKTNSIYDLGDPIFKNIAVEEDGSIYIVSYHYLWCLAWAHNSLNVSWKVAVSGQSGSTPALMGISPSDDRLVAITLNNQPAEIWLFWRHEIPSDWKGIENLDRRVAARVAVAFGGDPSQSFSSLNSLMVSGYGVLAANWTGMLPLIQAKRAGMARYDWQPASRTLELTWNNPNIWLPNSMQALSRKTQLLYAIGVEDTKSRKQYGLYGINWSDGGIAFFVPCGYMNDHSLNIEGSGIQIGPNREIITMSPWALIMFQAASVK